MTPPPPFPLFKPFLSHQVKHCLEKDMKICWVPSVWRSVTPPWKNSGYAPADGFVCWLCTSFKSIPTFLSGRTNKEIPSIYLVSVCEHKTKVELNKKNWNINCSTFVFTVDFCRLSSRFISARLTWNKMITSFLPVKRHQSQPIRLACPQQF